MVKDPNNINLLQKTDNQNNLKYPYSTDVKHSNKRNGINQNTNKSNPNQMYSNSAKMKNPIK